MNVKSTYWDIELNNKEIVSLTLNFAGLYKLRMKNKSLYDKYNRIQSKSINKADELDMTVILYTAYACANIEKSKMYSYEEFLELLPSDRMIVGDCVTMLLMPSKKKADLQKRSARRPNEQEGK